MANWNPDVYSSPQDFGKQFQPPAAQAPAASGNPWDAQGAWTPQNAQELRDYSRAQGWSEDFDRWKGPGGDATLQSWIGSNWDPNQRMFTTEKRDAQGNPISGFVEKPVDTPDGWMAWGDHAVPTSQGQQMMAGWGGGGAGGPGGGGGFSAGGAWGGSPQFQFTAPSVEDMKADPGYQAGLQQGQDLLQHSQAAQGMARTGGSLTDLMKFGQDYASQKYGDVYARRYQEAKDRFAPQYGAWNTQFGANEDRWRTQYGGDLSKYLQRENGILQLVGGYNPMPPQMVG